MDVLINNDCNVKSVDKCEQKTNDIKLMCEKGDLYINVRPTCCETVFFVILGDYPLYNLIGKKILSYSIVEKSKYNHSVMKLKLENSKSFYIGYCVYSNGFYNGWITFDFKN